MNIQQEIDRRNALFQNATREEKRKLIAQDVINLIGEGKMVSRVCYVVIPNYDTYDEEESVREIILRTSPEQPCKCCAMGALMLSCTAFNNQEKMRNYSDHFCYIDKRVKFNKPVPNGLFDIFSPQELLEIEKWFEGVEKLYFVKKYPDRTERLVAVMQSIIDNGKVMPPEGY